MLISDKHRCIYYNCSQHGFRRRSRIIIGGILLQKDAYTKKARQIIAHARTQAESLGHSFIGTEHLILSMLSDGSNVGAALLRTHRVPLNRFQQAVRSEVGSAEPSVLTESAVTPALRRILLKAEKQRPSGAIISSEVLLRTVLEDEQCGAAMLLRGMGVRRVYFLTVCTGGGHLARF